MPPQYKQKVASALCALAIATAVFANVAEANSSIVRASWYGEPFHGRMMASGKRFDMHDPTVAAHKTLPFGTIIRVRNIDTDATLYMVVQDRGPHVRDRDLDLSRAAAKKLGILEKGTGSVELEVLQLPNQ